MVDFGYDISDFTDIDPIFGTLEDFDDLVTAVHSRGMLNTIKNNIHTLMCVYFELILTSPHHINFYV